MKKLLVLLTLACATFAFAEGTVLKVIDFEESEGYTAGDLLNQNGWYSIFSGADRQLVVNDPTTAPSGSQYVTDNPENANAPNSAVKFDISEDYIEGSKLVISWDQAGNASQNSYVKLHNLGTTGRNYDVEIAELQIFTSGYASITVAKEDKSGTFSKGVPVDDPLAFHHFTLTIDPATKSIVDYTVDGNVVEDVIGLYYKNEAANATASQQGGSLIDGVRIMNRGAYDNFKVEMVPEPAFFGLIAILGLFFARKQR